MKKHIPTVKLYKFGSPYYNNEEYHTIFGI